MSSVVPRVADTVARARRYAGRERDTLVLLFKSLLAGSVAWVISSVALSSSQAVFAPFSALFVVSITVYRSLMDSARYIAAILAGVLVAGAIGPALGRHAGSFTLMLAIAVLIGRWRRLGQKGSYVATAALFSYTAASADQWRNLAEIMSMVLLGAGVGVTVNLALAPSLRYRSASHAIGVLADSIADLLADIAGGLAEAATEADTAQDWLRRARGFEELFTRARQAVEDSAENTILNPRRLLRRQGVPTFTGYRTMVHSLERAAQQLRSLSLGVANLAELDEDRDNDNETHQESSRQDGELEYRSRMGALLAAMADALRHLGIADHYTDTTPAFDHYQRDLDTCRNRLRETEAARPVLTENTDGRGPAYAALLVDARRLLDELDYIYSQRAPKPD